MFLEMIFAAGWVLLAATCLSMFQKIMDKLELISEDSFLVSLGILCSIVLLYKENSLTGEPVKTFIYVSIGFLFGIGVRAFFLVLKIISTYFKGAYSC